MENGKSWKVLEHMRCVLLLDDNDLDNYIHEKNFDYYSKFQCSIYNSPYAALEHLRHASIKYDYIVVDIYMPGMDGFTFVEHFRRLLLDTKHGPIIILTASLNPMDSLRATDMGLLFLEKPFRMEKLVELI